MKNNKIKKFFGRTLSVILMVFLLVGTIPIVGVSAAENEVEYKYFLNVNDVTYLQMHIAGNKNTDFRFCFVCEKFEFCVNKKIIPIKSQIVYGEVLLHMLFCDKMVNNTNCK